MSKVVFEFDDNEDLFDIRCVTDRHKLVTAINELRDLYSSIYNGKIYDESVQLYVKEDGNIATDEDYKKANQEGKFLSGGKSYLSRDWVENKLDNILDDVRHLLYF